MMIEFDRVRFVGVDGLPQVHYKQKYSRTEVFTIAVSLSGVKMKGTMAGEISAHAELQAFAKAIASAWEDFREIQRAAKGMKDDLEK